MSANKVGGLRLLFMRDCTRQKRKITDKGEQVKSEGERLIANYLADEGISYEYERRLVLPNKKIVVPDFTLPSWTYQLYIEYWGRNNDPAYDKRKRTKQRLYKKYCTYNLIDVYPKHLRSLDDYLGEMLHEKRRGWLHLACEF